MSKYDKLIAEKEARAKADKELQEQRQRELLEQTKKGQLIAEKLFRDVVLPDLSALQESLQKSGRKVTIDRREHHLESHNRVVLLGLKLLVIHPRVSPGLELDFSISNNAANISVRMLTGRKLESTSQDYPFASMTSRTVQNIIEEFVEGLYE